MRKLILALALTLAPFGAFAQQRTIPLVGNAPWSASNPGPVTGTVTIVPSGTQATNITQILGAAVSNTNPLFVAPSTTALFDSSAVGSNGSAAKTKSVLMGVSDGTNQQQLVAPIALTDGVNGNNMVASGSYVWNGAAWDRALQIPLGITPTDRTITSASGSSQQIMAANTARRSLTVQNTGSANCGVNPTGGTAAIGGAGTLTLAPLGSYSPRIPTLSAVTVICTSGQPIYASEK